MLTVLRSVIFFKCLFSDLLGRENVYFRNMLIVHFSQSLHELFSHILCPLLSKEEERAPLSNTYLQINKLSKTTPGKREVLRSLQIILSNLRLKDKE